MALDVEHLPSKRESLSSNTNTAKKNLTKFKCNKSCFVTDRPCFKAAQHKWADLRKLDFLKSPATAC
jgi:hypothetical protein